MRDVLPDTLPLSVSRVLPDTLRLSVSHPPLPPLTFSPSTSSPLPLPPSPPAEAQGGDGGGDAPPGAGRRPGGALRLRPMFFDVIWCNEATKRSGVLLGDNPVVACDLAIV